MQLTTTPYIYDLETLNTSIKGIREEISKRRKELKRWNATKSQLNQRVKEAQGKDMAVKILKLERIAFELEFIKRSRLFVGYNIMQAA